MASKLLLLLVILNVVRYSLQDVNNNEVDSEIESPLKEASASILKEQTMENIGGMVNNFLQSGGAKQLVDGVLEKVATSGNAGKILEGLGNFLNKGDNMGKSSKGNSKEPGGDLLAGLQALGSLMGTFQGGGDNNPLNVLQGLGSLMGGNENNGGFDPAALGQLVNMFADSLPEKVEKPTPSKKQKQKAKTAREEQNSFDLNDMLSLANSYLGQGSDGKKFNVMSFLPMLMQTFNSFVGPDAQQRAESHSGHSSVLPPILERIHLFFDNFLHSDMAKYILSYIGDEKSFKVFTDETGRFSYAKFTELIENHSFRRHWIQMLTSRIVSMLQYVTDPKKHTEYLTTVQVLFNGFLKNQGFPKKALFDTKKPAKSLTEFVNHAAKTYLDADAGDAREYVEPAVEYVQEILKMAQKSLASKREPKELSDKLADTINMEIIEPIIRVNRAYRFVKSQPKCDRYILCLINQNSPTEQESLPGLKKALYKGSSILAAWFVGSHSGTSFWDLYADITEDKNCHLYYSDSCDGFHAEEVKVTTEYVHSEL